MATLNETATRDYLSRHAVFTADELRSALPESSRASVKHRLDWASSRGWADRVARGVYVSRLGVFADRLPDGFELATRLGRDAVVSHAAALVALGLSHNVLRLVTFVSASKPREFAYRDYRLVRLPEPSRLRRATDSQRLVTHVRRGDAMVPVTSRERTLVDCLAQPRWSGGLEMLVRSAAAVPAWRDDDLLGYLDLLRSPTLVARTGWMLSLLGGAGVLDSSEVKAAFRDRIGAGPYYLGERSGPMRFVAEWRLYVPADADVEGWATG